MFQFMREYSNAKKKKKNKMKWNQEKAKYNHLSEFKSIQTL